MKAVLGFDTLPAPSERFRWGVVVALRRPESECSGSSHLDRAKQSQGSQSLAKSDEAGHSSMEFP